MGLFERFNAPPREDITEAPPQRGLRRFFFLLKNHFWKLIALNALFLLFSWPVITIPAAICGMDRVCVKLVREGNVFLWDEFWKEFKSQLINSLPIGLLYGVELAASYYCMSLSISTGGLFGVLFSAAGIILLLVPVIGGSYTFVMLALLKLTNGQVLRNAAALVGLEVKKSLIILGLSVIWAVFVLLLFPYSLLVIPLFYFAPLSLAVVNIANEAIQTHIVAPFEAAQAVEAGAAADAAAACEASANAADAAAADVAAADAAAADAAADAAAADAAAANAAAAAKAVAGAAAGGGPGAGG